MGEEAAAPVRQQPAGRAAEEGEQSLSIRECRIKRNRVAPSEIRMRTSRDRPALRASIRFATLRQVTSSTAATIAVSTSSVSVNRARRLENPRSNGTTASVCRNMSRRDGSSPIRFARSTTP